MCNVIIAFSEKYCLGFTSSLTNPKHEKTQAAGISSKSTRGEKSRKILTRAFLQKEKIRERQRETERNNEHDVLFLFLLRNSSYEHEQTQRTRSVVVRIQSGRRRPKDEENIIFAHRERVTEPKDARFGRFSVRLRRRVNRRQVFSRWW